jgi:hypothetical protein
VKKTRLFNVPYLPAITDLNIPYDVTADGERFLMSAPMGPPTTQGETVITVVLGWPSLLSGQNSTRLTTR